MLDSLNLSGFITTYLLPWLIHLLYAVLIAVGGWFAIKFIISYTKRYMERYEVDPLLICFTISILKWTLLLIVGVAALNQLGFNTTALIALLGAAGLAIGLALQDSLANFAAGVLLIIFRPFQIGNMIEAAGVTGTVQEITLFTTLLKTLDNQSVIIPNQKIYADIITNRSVLPTRRVDMVFGISYEDLIRQAREIVEKTLSADTRILEEPKPVIAVQELADSSVNLAVQPWINNEDYGDYISVRFDLMERIKLAFDDHGISIPFPQRDVHMNGNA